MNKKKVSIEIGHGGGDPGAVSGKIREKDVNLTVGLELKRLLELHGVEVLVNRTADVGFKVADFKAKAVSFAPDVGLSIHANAFNGSAKGFEVYRNTNAYKLSSNLLCAEIEKEVKKLGQTSRGIKDSPFIMSSLALPTAYCELGFVDNPNDYKQFDTPDKQKKFAEAYAKGVLNFFGISWTNGLNQSNNQNSEKNSAAVQTPAPAPATTPKPAQILYRVVAGSFSSKSNASAMMKTLKDKGVDCFIAEYKN